MAWHGRVQIKSSKIDFCTAVLTMRNLHIVIQLVVLDLKSLLSSPNKSRQYIAKSSTVLAIEYTKSTHPVT